MTVPNKGLRSLEVDGHRLRWSVRRRGVRGCPDCDELHLLVVGDERRGSFLLIHIPQAWGPDRPVTPRQTAAVTRLGLAAGWLPGSGPDAPFTQIADTSALFSIFGIYP